MANALSADPRGLKRICLSCSTRFYDMNKRPIVCPNCAVEFTGEVKIKSRRGRLATNDIANDVAEDEVIEKDNEDEIEEEESETVSLDEVTEADDGESDDDEAVELDEEDLDADDLDDEDLDDDDDDLPEEEDDYAEDEDEAEADSGGERHIHRHIPKECGDIMVRFKDQFDQPPACGKPDAESGS